MYEYDVLVCIRFLSEKNGGRKELPSIRNYEYTYRPVFRLDGYAIGYCCGVVIGDYIKNYAFETELNNIKIIFMNFQRIKNDFTIGKHFQLLEGNSVIATGKIQKIKEFGKIG